MRNRDFLPSGNRPRRIPPAPLPPTTEAGHENIELPAPEGHGFSAGTAPGFDASTIEEVMDQLQQRIDQLQASLSQQQKLATLGMVASVIAHEFNNILTPMISYTRYAAVG